MVRLFPMTPDELERYWKAAVEDYAQEHVRAGNWLPSEALQKAEKQFHQLLPDGTATPGQHLFTIEDAETASRVGMIWFAENRSRAEPVAFIYDFLIYPEYRRKGYGAQAMQAVEEEIRKLGISKIELHVFGHNTAARALYEKAGYGIAGIYMSKRIG